MKSKFSKEKIHAFTLTVLFALFVGVLGVLFWVLPKEETSELERRTLAAPPEISADSVFSGRFGKEAETYLSDHFPLRSFWVGLNAETEQLLGCREGVLSGKNGRLFPAPAAYNGGIVARNAGYIADFLAASDLRASYMIVPSAGALLPEELPALHPAYRDEEIIAAFDKAMAGSAEKIDLMPVLSEDAAAYYYKTDHHWTAQGAYAAYRAFCSQKGIAARESFEIERITGFTGTSYAKAGLWRIPAEEIELWQGSPLSVTVEDDGKEPYTADSPFFREALSGMDKYSVYLDGNHSLVRIKNPAAQGKLLVVKDSFAHVLVPFLAEHYGEIVMIDLRYYRVASLSELAENEGIEEVLFVYGTDSIAAGTDFLWLR